MDKFHYGERVRYVGINSQWRDGRVEGIVVSDDDHHCTMTLTRANGSGYGEGKRVTIRRTSLELMESSLTPLEKQVRAYIARELGS